MVNGEDMFLKMFNRQLFFMKKLNEKGKLPNWPIDITTKEGQRIIKECIFNIIGELVEASIELKNKIHRITDDREININHYKEELGDALAFFMEVCILSGIGATDIFKEYCRKNDIVLKRLEDGY